MGVENIVEKGENTGYQYFQLFQQRFIKNLLSELFKGCYLDFSHLTKLKNINTSLKFIWKNNTNHQ